MQSTNSLVLVKDGVVGAVELQLRSVNRKASGFFPQKGTKLHIANLCVQRSCRRQGIAKSLLEAVEYVADLWGHDSIFLHVSPSNEAAMALYQRAKYEVIPDNWPPLTFNKLNYLYKPLRPTAPSMDAIVQMTNPRR